MTTLASPASATPAVPGADDVPHLARTLFRAFATDPLARWVMPRDDHRLAGYRLWLRRVWLPRGGVVQLAGGDAAACWVPPHAVHAGALEQLRLLPAMARALGRGLPRALSALGVLDEGHAHEPHWYLPVMGVDPAAQGQGLGSALLRHGLERAARDGVGAYLEATTDRNRALYERHGFRVTAEERLPKDGPRFWRMWHD